MKYTKNLILLLALVGICMGFKPTKKLNQPVFRTIEKEYPPSKSFYSSPQEKDILNWVAPVEADKLKNPIDINDETLADGSTIYKINCRSCHGRKGDGKGVEAADLSSIVTDFTSSDFLNQTDGAIFWKIAEGRIKEEKNAQGKDDMEGFKDDLEEEEIWLLVNYIKTFSKEEDN